jgi:hypothetical protein
MSVSAAYVASGQLRRRSHEGSSGKQSLFTESPQADDQLASAALAHRFSQGLARRTGD